VVDSSRFAVETAGLSIRPRPDLKVGALRYFNAADSLPQGLLEILEGGLLAPLQAVTRRAGATPLTLAWRSPTETLVLCADEVLFQALLRREAGDWGCFVDQTGGLTIWEVTGIRTRDLLERLGSAASMPQPGEARCSRMADLPVLSVRTDEASTLLVFDRLYAEHLLGWVEEITADF
jgi:sarcosine oxidase gamma subunit